MSSFTRPYLKAIGLNDDQIAATMEAHVAVVNELKADRDKYKTEADKVPDLQKQLQDEQKKHTGENDYKKKYDDLVAENQAKESRKAKTAAYRKVALEDAGIGEQFIDLFIMAHAADIDQLEMDGDKIKDAEAVVKQIKSDNAQYVVKRTKKGPKAETPPKNEGDNSTQTRDEIMAITDRDERRAAIAEHPELFV